MRSSFTNSPAISGQAKGLRSQKLASDTQTDLHSSREADRNIRRALGGLPNKRMDRLFFCCARKFRCCL